MVMLHMAEEDCAEYGTAASALWTLAKINQQAVRVITPGGEHVGNLQYSNGQWKFKAVGYDRDGAILPGWGPLTDLHNTVFAAPDAALVNGAFAHLGLVRAP
jgi:hypothetical protein